MSLELLPTRSRYLPGEHVGVEVRDLPALGSLVIRHLGDEIAQFNVDQAGVVDLGELPPGGYSVELVSAGSVARTAIDISAPGNRPMRYGFVTDYHPGRDVTAVADNIRRLHLSDIQFYDWAYRHADLLGGGDTYDDALHQPISLDTVRSLITAVHACGTRALGYAAVYGVGNDEWPTWQHAALLTPSGAPYSLGDFLRLIDPADHGWLQHFTEQLNRSVIDVGFDGFHLDQYGYPKRATRPDGSSVTVEDSFAAVIGAARHALPHARLVFNNVNDFPTWRTGATDQDAIYIEVWPPHTTLGHLAAVVERANNAGGGKPVVIAAYQNVYDHAPTAAADLATAFTMATLFTHGATQLLCGEADRILIDPYYVRNHTLESSTHAMLTRWYDFAVTHQELLYTANLVDMTGSLAGPYNGDCDVAYLDTAVSETPQAGGVWRRITGDSSRLVIHLINLTNQTNTDWDAARQPVTSLPDGLLRVRRDGPELPRVRYADPDAQSSLIDIATGADGDYAVCELPPLGLWQLILIEYNPFSRRQ